MDRSLKWLTLAIGVLAVAVLFAGAAILYSARPVGLPQTWTASPGPDSAAQCQTGSLIYRVQQASMRPTLEVEDILLVDPVDPGSPFGRGDIVVFRPAAEEPPFVKRVIGIAGDLVEIRDGSVYLNGTQLHEPYTLGSTPSFSGPQSWLVPAGTLFVLGDNRANSTDSRSFGPVATDLIVGQITYRCDPPERRGPVA
jgi:signal peptidase I